MLEDALEVITPNNSLDCITWFNLVSVLYFSECINREAVTWFLYELDNECICYPPSIMTSHAVFLHVV